MPVVVLKRSDYSLNYGPKVDDCEYANCYVEGPADCVAECGVVFSLGDDQCVIATEYDNAFVESLQPVSLLKRSPVKYKESSDRPVHNEEHYLPQRVVWEQNNSQSEEDLPYY